MAERIEEKIKSGLASDQRQAQEADLRMAALEMEVNSFKRMMSLSKDISEELKPLFPGLSSVVLISSSSENMQSVPYTINVQWKKRPATKDLERVKRYLLNRIKEPGATVSQLVQVPNTH